MSAAIDRRAGDGRSLALLAAFLICAVLVTGVVSPMLLAALHALGVAQATLDEVTLRTLQLSAIAATFALLATLGCAGARAWGVPPRRRLIARIGAGVLLGVASLGLVCGVLFVLEVRVMKVDLVWEPGHWAGVAFGAALSAMAVALLEEFWFRGGLFTVLTRLGGAAVALWGGAAVYAATHFLEAADGFVAPAPWPGFAMLAHLLGQVFEAVNVDSFVALLAAGVVLGLVRIRQGDVALAIGIHAGWVFTIKVFKKLTYVSDGSGLRAMSGHYDDLIGWFAAAVLALMALALWWRLPHSAGARS